MSTAPLPQPRFVESVGTGWNRFWFTPTEAAPLGRLSQLVCLFTVGWLATFYADLTGLWATDGLLPPSLVHQVTTSGNLHTPIAGASIFFWLSHAGTLWIVHAVAMLVALLAGLGIASRWTVPATFLISLNYVHGGPFVMGLGETVLTMLLSYLAVGMVAGNYVRRGADWPATVTRRLIQLHICGFYLVIATNKLGTPIWWTGDATWYLLQDAQQRLLALPWLLDHHLIVNAVTHAWLGVELAFPVLIWLAPARRGMLAAAAIGWIWTGIVTGLLGYSLIMIVALTAFLEPHDWPAKKPATVEA